MIVTLYSIAVTGHASYYEYNIEYKLENKTLGQIIDEEIFIAYHVVSDGEPQDGSFGRLVPGQVITKSFTWQASRNDVISIIEFGGDYSSSSPASGTLKWKTPSI